MLQNLTELKHTLAPVFASYDISRAVLFGSLAAGTATETSDLDLMVESRLRGLRFVGFMEAVRQASGLPVDINEDLPPLITSLQNLSVVY